MQVNGVELNVQVSGEGVPVIWGHGLMGSMAMEDSLTDIFQWPTLAEQEWLVRYDARGHGKSQASPNLDDYHWSNLARDMLALADELGIKQFVAGGQSMGCATALYAALQAPERIRGLVLMNPPTAWETRKAQAAVYEQMAAAIEASGVAGLAGMFDASQPPAPYWLWEAQGATASSMAQVFGELDTSTLPLVLRGAALTDLPSPNKIQTIKVPALILAWSADPGHPLSTAEELQRLIADSQLEVAFNMEDLATWPGLIRDFVKTFA